MKSGLTIPWLEGEKPILHDPLEHVLFANEKMPYSFIGDFLEIQDFTDALDHAMKRMDAWFMSLTEIDKTQIEWARFNIYDGWDIKEFSPWGDYEKQLVVVNGRTYLGSDLNYAVWGKWDNLMCNQGFLTKPWFFGRFETLSSTYLFKQFRYDHAPTMETMDWAEAGLNGWRKNSGIYPRSSRGVWPGTTSPYTGRLTIAFGYSNVP